MASVIASHARNIIFAQKLALKFGEVALLLLALTPSEC
jgi:hypothetical protein